MALVFCVLSILLFERASVQAALPPTVQLTVHAADAVTATSFEQALREQLTAWPTWSLLVGPPLRSAPCRAGSPRAGLVVDITSSVDTAASASVALVDCAAWPVEQWTLSARASDEEDAMRKLAASVLFALRLWQHHVPDQFAALFDTGNATPQDGRCDPELSLVKTADGQLRAVVRAGGPAYVAGLRTNEPVIMIDGRDWWEYGTYQSQQRVHDGNPHVYTTGDSSATFRVGCSKNNGGI